MKSESHGLFFAIRPPADLVPEIAHLRETSGARRRRVDDRRLHVTVLEFGDYPILPAALLGALQDLDVDAPPFRIGFDQLIFGRKSVLLKASERVQGFDRLQDRLVAELRRIGVEPAYRPSPHITLHYDAQPAPTEPVDAISWEVTELLLIESLRGRGEHVVRRRWQLLLQLALELELA